MEADTGVLMKEQRKIHSSCIPLSLSPSSPFSSFFKVSGIFKCIITPCLSFTFIFHLPPSFSFPLQHQIPPSLAPHLLREWWKSVVVHGIINHHCTARKTHKHRRWEEHWGELFRVNRQILAAKVCSVLYWDTCSTGKLNPFFFYLFHLQLIVVREAVRQKNWESIASL